MKMVIVVLFLIFGTAGTVCQGGPLAALVDPAQTGIIGIDALNASIRSGSGRAGRTGNFRPGGQASRLRGRTSHNTKPSLVEILSDREGKEKTVRTERGPNADATLSGQAQYYVSSEYFPWSAGKSWAYLVDGSDISSVKILTETAIVNDAEAQIAVNEKTGVAICYTSDDRGILIHRRRFPDVYIRESGREDLVVTFIPPIRLADGVVDIGQTAYSIGTARYALASTRRTVDLNYTATYTVQAGEEVGVPAGIFDTLIFRGTLMIEGDFESEVLYLAKGVGLVKAVAQSVGQKTVIELSVNNMGSSLRP